jgi:hypothetical protein
MWNPVCKGFRVLEGCAVRLLIGLCCRISMLDKWGGNKNKLISRRLDRIPNILENQN